MIGWIRKSISAIAILLGCGLLAACSSTLADLPPISSTGIAEYRLQPGDEILVTVQDVDAANGSYIIDGTGMISLPLLREVQVAGLGLRQIESRIAESYRAAGLLNNPIVSVQPGTLRPFYVIGEVTRPGELPYRQGMTVLSAVSAAGGYSYRAHEGTVEIVRNVNGREVRSQASEDTPILPGDRIRVYERWF